MNFVYNLSVNLTTEVVIFYKGLLVYLKKEITAKHISANFLPNNDFFTPHTSRRPQSF